MCVIGEPLPCLRCRLASAGPNGNSSPLPLGRQQRSVRRAPLRANLSMMFQDIGFLDRFAAAAQHRQIGA
jgi:hypothetical protein